MPRVVGKRELLGPIGTNEITVKSSNLSYGGHGKRLRKIVETDEQGRFELPAEIDPSVLVVAHEAGYAEVITIDSAAARKAGDTPTRNNQALAITLQPWGRVEGRVLMGDKPVVGAKYWVYQSRADNVHVWARHNVESDADGRFVVEQIPPGRYGICQRYAENADRKGSHVIAGLLTRFKIPAGKAVKLEFGGGELLGERLRGGC